MVKIDGAFLKTWRERYRWPFCMSRLASEEKIMYLENLVVNNILRKGPWSVKDVFLEIVSWKTGGTQVVRFCKNREDTIVSYVIEVKEILTRNSNDVSKCVDIFSHLRGVAIPVASAFLRFLDPMEHKYGIIDKNVASLLNQEGVTNFHFDEHGYIDYSPENNSQYQRYHNWLQLKTKETNECGYTYTDVYGKERAFSPVDIDMALFTFSFAHKKRLGDFTPRRELRGQVLEWWEKYEEDMWAAYAEYLEEMAEEEFRREEYVCAACGIVMEKEDALFCQYCEAPLCKDCAVFGLCPDCGYKWGKRG